jgi:hypothetical protein
MRSRACRQLFIQQTCVHGAAHNGTRARTDYAKPQPVVAQLSIRNRDH